MMYRVLTDLAELAALGSFLAFIGLVARGAGSW